MKRAGEKTSGRWRGKSERSLGLWKGKSGSGMRGERSDGARHGGRSGEWRRGVKRRTGGRGEWWWR